MSTNIGLGAEKAILNGYKGITAWGGKIMAFDSVLHITFKNDEKFMEERKTLKEEIKKVHPQNGDEKFEKYNEWFCMLCDRMAHMGIYPGQEVDEEIITTEDEEDAKT